MILDDLKQLPILFQLVVPARLWVVYQFPGADLTKSVEISDAWVTFLPASQSESLLF